MSEVNLKNVYLVSGRISGDDDDTQYMVKADNAADASDIFTEQLLFDLVDKDDENPEVIVVSSTPALELFNAAI